MIVFSCVDASVTGGICNNSDSSLIRRDSAYTENSLFSQIDESSSLQLVNYLGIDLGETSEQIFQSLEQQNYVIK